MNTGIAKMPAVELVMLQAPNTTAIFEAKINGPTDQAEQREARRHQAGAVHQIAEQDVVDADAESWSHQERPIVDRDERSTGDHKRSAVGADRCRQIPAQR